MNAMSNMLFYITLTLYGNYVYQVDFTIQIIENYLQGQQQTQLSQFLLD